MPIFLANGDDTSYRAVRDDDNVDEKLKTASVKKINTNENDILDITFSFILILFFFFGRNKMLV